MSLYKAIEHGKEHRKPWSFYRKKNDYHRNHGPDYYANENRLFNNLKKEKALIQDEKEYLFSN